MLDGYGIHTMIWDSADERLGDWLVASPAGATGPTGPQGPAGADGTSFAPSSPLSLSNGILSIDLSSYATQTWVNTQIQAAIDDLNDLSEVSF